MNTIKAYTKNELKKEEKMCKEVKAMLDWRHNMKGG